MCHVDCVAVLPVTRDMPWSRRAPLRLISTSGFNNRSWLHAELRDWNISHGTFSGPGEAHLAHAVRAHFRQRQAHSADNSITVRSMHTRTVGMVGKIAIADNPSMGGCVFLQNRSARKARA